jgi:hypothetical protein
MDATIQKQSVKSVSWVNVVLGIWLIISPYVLNFGQLQTAMCNNIAVGIAVGLIALTRATSNYPQTGASWLNVILGIWLIISPFALGFSSLLSAMWNNIILGIVVGILALTNALSAPATAPTNA